MGVSSCGQGKGKLSGGNPIGDVRDARAEFSFAPDMLYTQLIKIMANISIFSGSILFG